MSTQQAWMAVACGIALLLAVVTLVVTGHEEFVKDSAAGIVGLAVCILIALWIFG